MGFPTFLYRNLMVFTIGFPTFFYRGTWWFTLGFSFFSYRDLIVYHGNFQPSYIGISWFTMGFPTFLYRNRRIWWFTIGLPTLSGVLPTNKNIPPPIRKPQPIYSDLFLLLAAFALVFFLQGLDQDCIASGFLIHLWQMLLVQFLTFQDAKTHKKKGIL